MLPATATAATRYPQLRDDPPVQSESHGLLSGRLLVRNSVLNLAGQAAPLVVAVITIPLLLAGLGTERFGVLTLAWVVIGYFSLFDFGVSRALTQLVAESLGRGRDDEVAPLVWTALLMMLLLGVVGALVLAGITPWAAHRALGLPAELRAETVPALYLLALGVPAVIGTAGLRGVLEATQRFGVVNAIRVPMGVFTFAGPLLVLPFTTHLAWVVGVLVVGRVLAWVVHLVLCLRLVPGLWTGRALRPALMRRLLGFGGWMTISNVVGPFMVYFDRFLIAAVLSVAAVAYYATPYELVTKLWLIPTSVLGVLFPAFALSHAGDRGRFTELFKGGVLVVWALLFPLVLAVVTFAPEGLTLWLGTEFAEHGTPVLRWLAVGVLINSVGMVPFSALQGAGRPDLTAKLHLVELPLYAALLWWLTVSHGITGAALAWTSRVAFDTLLLFVISARVLPRSRPVLARAGQLMLGSCVVLGTAPLLEAAGGRALLAGGGGLALAAFVWLMVATEDERGWLSRAVLAARPGT
jgi:O-antigen/teichoic acid export membrane protein